MKSRRSANDNPRPVFRHSHFAFKEFVSGQFTSENRSHFVYESDISSNEIRGVGFCECLSCVGRKPHLSADLEIRVCPKRTLVLNRVCPSRSLVPYSKLLVQTCSKRGSNTGLEDTLSSEYGTRETAKARFWPWLEKTSVRKYLNLFELVSFRSEATRPQTETQLL
jgi:hypothetical protein